MSRFESGVASYIHGTATVTATFPVDLRGSADVCCMQCFFYRESARRCGLTGLISEYPNKYIGSNCPLIFENYGENADQ